MRFSIDNVGTFRRISILILFMLVMPLSAAAQADAAALWEKLANPVFTAERIGPVEALTLDRDAAKIALANGNLAIAQPVAAPVGNGDKVFAAVFRGNGSLELTPSQWLEQQQLFVLGGRPTVKMEFTEAVFVFTDDTGEELENAVTFATGDPGDFEGPYRDRAGFRREYGLEWMPRLLKSALSDDPQPYQFFSVDIKTEDRGWFTLVVDAADPEGVELVEQTPDYKTDTIWAKFPTEGRSPQLAFADPFAPYDYSIRNYRLDVQAEENADLSGSAEVEFDVLREGERVLLLELEPNLRVASVTTADGSPLAFFQPREPKDDFFWGNELTVASPNPFPKGALTLKFTYGGKRVVRKEGEGTYFCQSFGWYPTYSLGRNTLSNNPFATRVPFDITLRVPKNYRAVVTGELVGDEKDGDYRVTRWKTDPAIRVAGFAFGRYIVKKEKAGSTNVTIYANEQADNLFRTIEAILDQPMPEQNRSLHANTASTGRMTPARLASDMAVEMANSVRVFEAYFGPYPYKELSVANIPYFYGQGWPGLIYLSSISFLDSTQRNRLGIQTNQKQFTDLFRAHETSHQWWGHVIGWNSYHDQWLSEGFANYSGMLYTLVRSGPAEFLQALRESRRDLLTADRNSSSQETTGPIYAGLRLNSSYHQGAYGNLVYNKGGWVLHMLRQMMIDTSNPQPDHRFIAMMQDFTSTFNGKAASTEDFKRIVEKHMTPGMNLAGDGKMDWFFNQWVYGTGVPTYHFSYVIENGQQPGTYVLKGSVRQEGVPESFMMPVPLYITKGENTILAGWINVTGKGMPFEAPLGFKPDRVSINEWEDVLSIVRTN